MSAFIDWLRVRLLRLRSFDWGHDYSCRCDWLKDGVAKYSSFYSLGRLKEILGMSEDAICEALDSPAVTQEVEGKSFTISWKGDSIVLSWLEEGIKETKMDISVDYYEEDGKFYQKHRIIDRLIYLDGTERILQDTGEPKPVSISKESFVAGLERTDLSTPCPHCGRPNNVVRRECEKCHGLTKWGEVEGKTP